MTLFLWEGGIERPRLQSLFMASTSFNGGGEAIAFLCWVTLLGALSEHTLSASSSAEGLSFYSVSLLLHIWQQSFFTKFLKIPLHVSPKILKTAPPSSCRKSPCFK